MIAADVVVVGAGPAGIAAATAAAELGQLVLVLDDNPSAGGQIWRGLGAQGGAKGKALQRFARSGAELLTGCRVFDVPAPNVLHAFREDSGKAIAVRYRQLVLATGARERFLPFPGWTLPGVFGVGALQALVKGGFSVRRKRVVVAGSGPLLLAVGAFLRSAGAEVVSVAEQASEGKLAGFSVSLWSEPVKLMQGLKYRIALGGVPYRTGCWPVEALAGSDGLSLRGVRLTNGRRSWEESCDLLACGFHLIPNTELAQLLGCAFDGDFVRVDADQRTSKPDVFCVGEPTGIGGLDAALVQGEIAGLVCAKQPARSLQRRANAGRRFAAQLEKAFALRPELKTIARPETIVCRCEDVLLSELEGQSEFREAKIQTRCGMGACQARICGPALGFLFNWKQTSVRPPVFPVPLEALCMNDDEKIEEKA